MWGKRRKGADWGNIKGTKREKGRHWDWQRRKWARTKTFHTHCMWKCYKENHYLLWQAFFFKFHMFQNWRLMYFYSRQRSWAKGLDIHCIKHSVSIGSFGRLAEKPFHKSQSHTIMWEMDVACRTDMMIIQSTLKAYSAIHFFCDLALPVAHNCYPLLLPQDWLWSKFCWQNREGMSNMVTRALSPTQH